METSHLKQKATYLAANGTVDVYGKQKLSTAIEIEVRWEEKSENILEPDGTVTAVTDVVIVDRDIPVRSIMWLGSLLDFNNRATHTDLREVYKFDKTPDIKGRNFRRVCKLVRHSNQLPEVV